MTDVFAGLPELKLTTEQENKLAVRGTPAAHNKLVMHAMRDALKYTKRVSRDEIPDEQLMSLCYDALMHAAKRFKPNWARFFAYAKADLRGVVSEHFGSLKVVKKGLVLSRDALNDECRHTSRGDWRPENGDNIKDVEAYTGEWEDPDFKTIKLHEQWALVEPLIRNHLSEREFMIVDLHYRCGWTLAQIGKKLGVTCEAIRHIRCRALKRIRNKLLSRHQLYSHY
jgi:RNA polymerase sigma factor (sigma-70 family)